MIGLQLTSRSSLLNKSLFGNRYRHRHLIPLSRMCHKSQCVIGTGFPAIVLLSGCCCIEGRGGILFLLLIDCMQSHISGIQVYSDIQATYQAKFTGGRG